MQQVVRPDRPGRADRRHGPDHRRERHRQGAGGADDPRAQPRRARSRSCRSTAARSRRPSSRASSSATSAAASRAPTASTRATSSARTAARCSSTRSPRCRWSCRSSCCACSRPARSRASAAAEPIKVDVRVIAATNRAPRAGGGGGQAARGPALPPERVPDPAAAAARAARGHRAAGRALPRRSTRTRAPPRSFSPAALERLRATPGRATCAS